MAAMVTTMALAAGVPSVPVIAAASHAGAAAGATPVTLYPITRVAMASGITLDHRGRHWFTESYAEAVGMVDDRGVVHEYAAPTGLLPSTGGGLDTIVTAPDGAIWFLDVGWNDEQAATALDRITDDGTVTRYAVPGLEIGTLTDQMVFDESGRLWIADQNAIVEVLVTAPVSVPQPLADPHTLSAIVYPVAPGMSSSGAHPVQAITIGPDGAVWFGGGNIIGRMPAGGGMATEYPLDSRYSVQVLVSGPDGNLWVALASTLPAAMLRMGMDGHMTFYSFGEQEWLTSLTAGGDGTMWFAAAIEVRGSISAEVGRVDSCGRIDRYELPFAEEAALAAGISWGSQHTVWMPVGLYGDSIARIDTRSLGFPRPCRTASVGHTRSGAAPTQLRVGGNRSDNIRPRVVGQRRTET